MRRKHLSCPRSLFLESLGYLFRSLFIEIGYQCVKVYFTAIWMQCAVKYNLSDRD